MKYMLDTNICIYAIKNRPEQVLEHIKDNMEYGMCISSITLAELEHGVAKSAFSEKNRAALTKFLTILEVLPFDDSAAREYGEIYADLQKQGTPIGMMDALIAGHSRSKGLTLVTNNVREFKRVPGLYIENWAE